MDYIETIRSSIEYIERNIDQPLCLEVLAAQSHLSKFHYLRIFKAVTDMTPVEYINGRRLSMAAQKLVESNERIIDIAFSSGFRSQQVFSRNFHGSLGLSPKDFRQKKPPFDILEKLNPVNRNFKNLRKSIVIRSCRTELNEIILFHRSRQFNPDSASEMESIRQSVALFDEAYLSKRNLSPLITVTESETSRENTIVFRYGYPSTTAGRQAKLRSYAIPRLRYAVFHYKEEFSQIYKTVFDDVCRALIAEDLTISKTGFDFLTWYEDDYTENGFKIFVPIC